MNNKQTENLMNLLQLTFPNDHYWNHHPNLPNDRESVRGPDYPCNHHENVNCEDYLSTGGCGCNSFGNGIQCNGFAKYMAFRISGHCPQNMTSVSANGGSCGGGWTVYRGDYIDGINLEPGDLIHTSRHSALVHTVSDGNSENERVVTTAEAYGSFNCRIGWGKFNNSTNVTEATIKSQATYIVKAPKTGSATEVNITFGFRDGKNDSIQDQIRWYGAPMGYVPKPEKPNDLGSFIGWWSHPNNQTKEFTGETIINASDFDNRNATVQTLYAHWASTFKISLYQSNLYLTVDASAATALAEHDNVKLASANDSNAQKWLMTSAGTGRVVKSAIDPRFGFNIYAPNSTKNCDVYRTAGNEHDALVDFILQSDGTVKIKLSNYDLYLTATGTANGADVKWQAASDSNLQKWTVTIL